MVMKTEEEITSVKDLFNLINWHEFTSKRVLFRGQDVDKPLLPKFARLGKERGLSNPIKYETQLMEFFKKQSLPYLIYPVPTTEWDWLAVAQHYGLPTRLLDWTANGFIGLWFAVTSIAPDDNINPVLWVLEADLSDIRSPLDNEKFQDLKRTYVFQPSCITNRIAAQAGWFTIHKYIEGSKKFLPLDKNINFTEKLTKYKIQSTAYDEIRTELRQMGLSRFSLFPELSSLCEVIRDEILVKPNVDPN